MKRASLIAFAAALFVSACGTTASDSVVTADAGDAMTAPGAQPAPAAGGQAEVATQARPAQAPVPARETAARERPARATFRELTLPAGTLLSLRLTTPVASDTSRVEDVVGAEFTHAVTIDGLPIIPAGARAAGIVTVADESARVKGLALLTLQFTSIQTGGSRYDMRTEPVSWEAPATKGGDAVKIGIGAGAGAALGAILGGKSGAAKGAVVGGAAGTGVVLATRGEEVRLTAGTDTTTRLSAPLTVRLSVSN
jgi:hypothetical protein